MEFEEVIGMLEDECVEIIKKTDTEVHIRGTAFNEMLVNKMDLEKPKFSVEFREDEIVIKWRRFLNGWW